MNINDFAAKMAYLQKLYGKELEKEVYGMYWEQLKEYPDVFFDKMILNITKSFIPTSQVPFPLLPHFLSAVGEDQPNKAIQAVTAVKLAVSRIGPYKSVSFGDRALHATIRRFGGWVGICNWNDEDWQYSEKKFMDCYRSELSHNDGPDHLCGHAEGDYIANAGNYLPDRLPSAAKQIEPVKVEWHGYQKLLPGQEKKIEIENKIVSQLSEKMSIKL